MKPATELEPHPKGLYVLFGAEAWERFSYYGMRALLTLYLVNQLKFARKDALEVYGVYTGLVYLTPIAGGYIADKLLGRRKAVFIGGLLMALGHLAMAFEPLLYMALGLLIVGNGFFKPNISTVVGGLYKEGDARRDGAFTIFYMGINLGGFLSPIVCGALGEGIGWHYGFSAATIGMLSGIGVFAWGQHLLGKVGMPPGREAVFEEAGPSAVLGKRDYLDIALWVAGGAAVVWLSLQAWVYLGPQWAAVGAVPKLSLLGVLLAVVMYLLFRKSTKPEKEELRVVVILCLFNIFFWMGFEQAGGTMTLFADKQTDRSIGWLGVFVIALTFMGAGWNVYRNTRGEKNGRTLWLVLTVGFLVSGPGIIIYGAVHILRSGFVEVAASQFQAINGLLIVALAPSFSRLWLQLDAGRFRTSTSTKMAIGLIFLGLGFMVMFAGQRVAGDHGKAGPQWLAIVYALHTIGELCLSPIGLSMVTKLAPPRVASLAMGVWLASSAAANYLAGTLESLLEQFHVPLYGFLVCSSIGPAILLLLLTPLLTKWTHGKA